MRKEYDFSGAKANPYIKRLRKDEARLAVDDNEMEEILSFEEDLKRGLDDIKEGRYRVIG